MNKRIGFFAGSFDPIHYGHLEVARSAVKFLDLEKLYFIVEQNSWTDKQPISINHRRNMLELAVAKDKKLEQLKLQDKQFTIGRTLAKIEAQFPEDELFFIFGADVFMGMNEKQWPDLHKLLEHYIVVFERNIITEADIASYAKTLGIVTAIIPSPHLHHSSSVVRLKPHEKTIWIPKNVAAYIDDKGLY